MRLQRALSDLIKEGNEKKIQDMVTRSRNITDFEACDYVLIPVNSNAQHWTAVFIDIWNGSMFYYDLFTNRMKNETVVKSIKFFFAMLYEFHKTCDIRIRHYKKDGRCRFYQNALRSEIVQKGALTSFEEQTEHNRLFSYLS